MGGNKGKATGRMCGPQDFDAAEGVGQERCAACGCAVAASQRQQLPALPDSYSSDAGIT